MELLKKLKLGLPCYPAMPLLSTCPTGSDSYPEILTVPRLLFHAIPNSHVWIQLSCPSTDEWLEKVWSINMVEIYSVRKKRETMIRVGKWTEQKITT